jgi:hypothetical protein
MSDKSEKSIENKNYIVKIHLESCKNHLKDIYYKKRAKYSSKERYSILISHVAKTISFDK